MACKIHFICTQSNVKGCKWLFGGSGFCPYRGYYGDKIHCEFIPAIKEAINKERERIK